MDLFLKHFILSLFEVYASKAAEVFLYTVIFICLGYFAYATSMMPKIREHDGHE